MFGRVIEKVKLKFSQITSVSTGSTQITANKNIVQNLTGNWIELSKFHEMTKPAIFSQFMTLEPEIAGAIDRYGTLTASAYKGVYVRQGNELDQKEMEMLVKAHEIEESMKIKDHFEAIAEMLMGQGNCFIIPNKDLSFTYLPPEYVSYIEDMKQLGTQSSTLILTHPEILVVNERGVQELEQQIFKKGSFVHIKYKETPQIVYDIMGRRTFGFYAISPLERTIMSIWWKRQITIVDVMWRYRNLPRDHHKINAEVYSLDKYSGGDWSAKRIAAKRDADSFISSYTNSLTDQAPDQGYVSLDTVDIKRIGGDSINMGTNEIIKQIEDHIWTALNIPPSTVNGSGAGSYASELVISNYVSGKVVQLAEKIKPFLLDMMRKRLLAIDSSFPVHELDMKLELTMATSQMENVRQMTLMAAVPIFTENELRAKVGFESLSDEERKSIVTTKTPAGQPEKENITTVGSEDKEDGSYPDTPMSESQHTRDTADNVLRSDENSREVRKK